MSQGAGDAIDAEKILEDKKECEEVHQDGEVEKISNAAEAGGEENSGKLIVDSEVVSNENGSNIGVTGTAKDENDSKQEDSKSAAEVKTDDIHPSVNENENPNNTSHAGDVHGGDLVGNGENSDGCKDKNINEITNGFESKTERGSPLEKSEPEEKARLERGSSEVEAEKRTVQMLKSELANKMQDAEEKSAAETTSKAGKVEVPVGHTNEIREKIEKTWKAPPASPTKPNANVPPTPPTEEKRKKKADEWLSTVKRSTSSVGEYRTTRTPIVSRVGVESTANSDTKVVRESSWKKKEEQAKKEKEEKEAQLKLLAEKKKKIEEERKKLETERRAAAAAREQAKKQKEEEDKARRDQLRKERSDPVPVRKLHKNGITGTSVVIEDEMEKKNRILESRIHPLHLENLDKEGLEKLAQELHDTIRRLEEQKYDLEVTVKRQEVEISELKGKSGDTRGKFVKPLLKKVEKFDQKNARTDAIKSSSPPPSAHSNSTTATEEKLESDNTIGQSEDCDLKSPEFTETVVSGETNLVA